MNISISDLVNKSQIIKNYIEKSNTNYIEKYDKIKLIDQIAKETMIDIVNATRKIEQLKKESGSDNEIDDYIKYIQSSISMLETMNSEQYLSKNGLLVSDIKSTNLPSATSKGTQLNQDIFKFFQKLAPILDPSNAPKLSYSTVTTIRKNPKPSQEQNSVVDPSTNKKYALKRENEKIRELLKTKKIEIKKYLGISSEQVN